MSEQSDCTWQVKFAQLKMEDCWSGGQVKLASAGSLVDKDRTLYTYIWATSSLVEATENSKVLAHWATWISIFFPYLNVMYKETAQLIPPNCLLVSIP